MTPPLLGLTGGIAAGKSEALAAFERCGAATLSTDRVTHELLDTGPVRNQLIDRWGEDVAPGGSTDRSRIAELVFGKPEELRWLESLIHPLVGQRIADWRCSVGEDLPAGVIEVPLLFESGLERAFDFTVAVIADPETVAGRLAERGMAAIEGRAGRQLDPAEKAERADFVIHNDGSIEDLEAAARNVLDQARQAAPSEGASAEGSARPESR